LTVIEKPFLAVLGGQRRSPAPTWLMRQAGRYLPEYRELRAKAGGFLAFCMNPPAAAEATLQPIRRYGLDAAILFSDILVVPYAVGQSLDYLEGEGPKLGAVRTQAEIEALDWVNWRPKLDPVIETVSRIREQLPQETALIGFAGSPWTVAAYMIEGGGTREWFEIKAMGFRQPDLLDLLLDRLVDVTADYLIAQVDAGAEVLQLFESWAGVLPVADFHRFVIKPTAKLVAKVRARHPNVPIIGFPRGAGTLIPAYVAGTGVTAVSVDQTVDPVWLDQALPPHVPVQGDLDPILLKVGGQPLVDGIRQSLKHYPNRPRLFNLGHGVLQWTPPENVTLLLQTIREGA